MKIENSKKIVVFRALQLGDMLCAIPAVRALHQAYPGAKITLIGLAWAKMLTERFPEYFHSVITFPGYPGLPEQSADYSAFPDFLKKIQNEHFDLALQMQGNGVISNPLVALFEAKNIAGFYMENNFCPDKDLFIEYPATIHEIERHLKLMEALGITEYTTDLEFPILEKDIEDFEKAALPVQPNKYVIIHPGARDANRQWEPQNFAAIANFFYEMGFKIVITGTDNEKGIVESVISFMNCDAINAVGKTSLGAIAVLIKNAAVLVSNCTGVSHIAAALKTKSLIISLNEEPDRWAPLNKTLHKTIIWSADTDFTSVLKEAKVLLMQQPEESDNYAEKST